MTFYLTHNNFNQPQNLNQYQPIPQKAPSQPIYQNKFIIANYQPKFADPPPTQIIIRPKPSFTPFLESNKLPGAFTPMLRPQTIQIPQQNYQQPISNEPNFSAIFDKLLQMKQLQKIPQRIPQYQGNTKLSIAAQYYRPQTTKFIPVNEFIPDQESIYKPLSLPEQESLYKPIPVPEQENIYKTVPSHVKTIIHTYTPSSIDIPLQDKNPSYDNYESLKLHNQVIPVKVIKPVDAYKPLLVQNIPQKNYETFILRPVPKPDQDLKQFRPFYRPVQFIPVPKVTTPQPIYNPTENPNSLSVILKQLQDSNTLPHTLTPDNIDNSIKTLVHILNSLKNTKLQRPIIVDDVSDVSDEEEHDSGNEDDDSFNENYPLSTPEGGTPGKPGEDYPAYASIPSTRFNCKTQRYKGFFGDPETNCQVRHLRLTKRQISSLNFHMLILYIFFLY